MLFRNSFVLRFTASFLLVEAATQLAWPAVSYALTSGPTAPEATSFEPVDTTDMVNLSSGDFTYNMPLLEVPGPEGGYPISLSYHAGIQPDVDASWVGLGWTLNPGAISRNVNSYADDHENAQQVVRDYWEGGTQTSVSIGVNVGIDGTPASVSFGLTFAQDTYKGFGAGGYVGLGYVFPNSPLSVGVSAALSPYGDVSVGAGVTTRIGSSANNSMALSVGLGVSTNFSNVNVSPSASVTSGGASILGASISSQGTSPSLSVGGGSVGIDNPTAGRISTSTNSIDVEIPLPGVMVSLGYSETRYWSDEVTTSATNGALYFPKAYQFNATNYSPAFLSTPIQVDTRLDNVSYDTYRLREQDIADFNENTGPVWGLGGSFADYDNYSVTAQGLSGSMRPYSYKVGLYSNNFKDGANGDKYAVADYPQNFANTAMHFRFDNDFSNEYRQYSHYSGNSYSYGFDTSPSRGDIGTGAGYNSSTDELAGSKHIEYFTNHEILTGGAQQRGFIDAEPSDLQRLDNSQIGGFKITNSSGVTYHYSLPAYSKEEHVYTENSQSPANSISWNKLDKPIPYAYTWYLTAMTGPDFVDRGVIGRIDAQDWGYWVSFDYGLLTHNYNWRNPYQGWHMDLDNHFRQYSTGIKDIYYLDAIRTRTHTALFVKEGRADAKSNVGDLSYYDDNTGSNVSTSWFGRGIGGFGHGYQAAYTYHNGGRAYSVPASHTLMYPTPQLRLKTILLFKNEDIQNIRTYATSGTKYNSADTYQQWYHSVNGTSLSYLTTSGKAQNTYYLLDDGDLPALGADYVSKTIRSVQFNYNYSLCPKTPNSFSPSGEIYKNNVLSNYNLNLFSIYVRNLSRYRIDVGEIPIEQLGKSTLTSVVVKGIGGMGVMPPTRFSYEQESAEQKKGTAILNNQGNNGLGSIALTPITGSSAFASGDIIRFSTTSSSPSPAYAVLLGPTNNGFNVRFLNSLPAVGTYNVVTTKNPPYVKDAKDKWGMFKSDFDTDLQGTANSTLFRDVSEVSSKSLDVWSLRRISSPLGSSIKVNYEPDTYHNSVYSNPTFIGELHGVQAGVGNSGQPELFFPYVVSTKIAVGDTLYAAGVIGNYSYTYNGSYSGGSTKLNGTFYMPRTPLVVTLVAPSGNGEQVKCRELSSNPVFFCNGGTYACANWNAAISMYITKNKRSITKGGGLRVASISVGDEQLTKKTLYDYDVNGASSGSTSYEPDPISSLDKQSFDNHYAEGPGYFDSYKRDYYSPLARINALARQLPAPGVMYEYTTIREQLIRGGVISTLPGATTYQFSVFQRGMLDIQKYRLPDVARYPGTSSPSLIQRAVVRLQDFTSQIGTLKRVTRYADVDRRVKLSETVNQFLHDGLPADFNVGTPGLYESLMNGFANQGMIQEAFGDCRQGRRGDLVNYDIKSVTSQHNTFPTIQTGTTQTDFVTNTTTTSQTLAFDFFSGAPTQTISVDGFGNRTLSTVTPAYRKYPSMGPRIDDGVSFASTNRNMLTQPTATIVYKADASNYPTSVIGASVDTWSNAVAVMGAPNNTQAAIWRKQASYAWMPVTSTTSGLTPLSGTNAFVPFNFTTAASAAAPWKKTAEITWYNPFSQVLEATDLNGLFAATKMGFNDSRVLVTGSPARYEELAYAGAEDAPLATNIFSGGTGAVYPTWNTAAGEIVTTKAHTGTHSVLIHSSNNGVYYQPDLTKLDRTKPYRASVWSSHPNTGLYYCVDGQTCVTVGGSASRVANGWYLINLDIPPLGSAPSSLRVGTWNGTGQDVYVDDFRFQPANAQTNAYVYNSASGQVTDILDNNNLATHYDYDAAGRLKKVSRETIQYGVNSVASHEYHLAAGPIDLDDATLVVQNPATGPSRGNYQVQVLVPGNAASYVIAYNSGDNSGSNNSYTSVPTTAGTIPTFTVNYSIGGTYWLKVRIRNSQNKQRELVKKLIFQ